jgi:hypothetical protein
MENHNSLNTNRDVFWQIKRSEKCGDALNDMAIQQIMDYWTTQTTISPNVKDVTQRKIALKQYDVQATHYLQVPKKLDVIKPKLFIQCLNWSPSHYVFYVQSYFLPFPLIIERPYPLRKSFDET